MFYNHNEFMLLLMFACTTVPQSIQVRVCVWQGWKIFQLCSAFCIKYSSLHVNIQHTRLWSTRFPVQKEIYENFKENGTDILYNHVARHYKIFQIWTKISRRKWKIIWLIYICGKEVRKSHYEGNRRAD